MTNLYTIKGENQTIKVLILENATKTEHKTREIPLNYVVIQDYNTGQTGHIERNKLIFNQTL